MTNRALGGETLKEGHCSIGQRLAKPEQPVHGITCPMIGTFKCLGAGFGHKFVRTGNMKMTLVQVG